MRSHLIKVKDDIKLAHVAKVFVQELDEKVDGFEVHEFVVVDVDSNREKEPRVPPVHKLVAAELHAQQVDCIVRRVVGRRVKDDLQTHLDETRVFAVS